MIKALIPFALILSVLISTANSQVIKQQGGKAVLKAEIDSILRSQVDEDKIPGAVIQIKQGKKIIYRHAYGYGQKYDYNHQLLTRPEKMKLKHLFDLASLTKVVGTTSAVMLLVDKGLIRLDDSASKYIPAFDTPEKNGITIRHLLTHTSGLIEWYPLYYRATNKQETYQLIGELPLKYPIGAQRHYSDLGFVLLGEIVELISGQPFDQFLKNQLLEPLGMKNTLFNPGQTKRFKKIAATSPGNPYEKRMVYDSTLGFKVKEIDPDQWNGWRTYTLRGEVNDGNAWYANGGVSGAAGLFSTVKDLQKLIDCLMHKENTPAIISPKTISTFLTKDSFNNGLGWMMDPANSFIKNGPEGSFGHTGFTGTSIAVIPDKGISIILLINRQNMGLSNSGDYYNVSPIRQQVFQAVMKYSN